MKLLTLIFLFVCSTAIANGVNEDRPISKNSLSKADKEKFEKQCSTDWDLEESNSNYVSGFVTVHTGETAEKAFIAAGKSCENFKSNTRSISSGGDRIQNNYSEIKSRQQAVENQDGSETKYYISEGICCTSYIVD